MTKINQTVALNENITLLQNKQSVEWVLLKEQFHDTYEGLKPLNLIKSTFKEVVASPDIKENILNDIIGISSGYVTKLVLFGGSRNPIARLTGTFIQFAVTNIVAKHPDFIKSTGLNIIEGIRKFKKKEKSITSKTEDIYD